MEEDKRLKGNLRYRSEATKIGKATIKAFKDLYKQTVKTGAGIFTNETVEKYAGEER